MRTLIAAGTMILLRTYGAHLDIGNIEFVLLMIGLTLCLVQDFAELKHNLKE